MSISSSSSRGGAGVEVGKVASSLSFLVDEKCEATSAALKERGKEGREAMLDKEREASMATERRRRVASVMGAET